MFTIFLTLKFFYFSNIKKLKTIPKIIVKHTLKHLGIFILPSVFNKNVFS